jgi:UDP-apiose/xylose synthase
LKILNLGCSGFVGSHITERLLAEGHTVIGVDVYSDKIEEFIDHENLVFIEDDIRSQGINLDKLVETSDLVIDLIAYANPGLYIKIPLEVFRLNFTENLKIAEACVRHKKRLLQFSSCEVYGKTVANVVKDELSNPEDPRYALFSEDKSDFILGHVGKHRWIYACAKQLLERVIHAYGIEQGFQYTIIRPFNFIGPKIDYLLDETDGIPRVFSFFMDALISGTKMKLVNGGHHRRCYTYIDDAIECIYRIVENPGNVCDKQIFNIGTPENEISMRELAVMMREIYAEKYLSSSSSLLPEIIEVSAEDFYGEGYEDSDRRIPDITKANRLLGWKPKWNLRDMLEITMRYYVSEYIEYYRKEGKPVTCSHHVIRKVLETK